MTAPTRIVPARIAPTRIDWLEDFIPGTRTHVGTIAFTAEEIVAFARQFDPQSFHIDEDAARRSPYGGLIASGWHTMSKIMKLVSQAALDRGGAGFIVSPGFEDLRWLKPSRPGDVLDVWTEVVSATPSASRPDRGLVIQRFSAVNAAGETVCSVTGKVFFRKREGSDNGGRHER
ncbi:MaoC family dehydratase [Zavarzinia compransoris]|uniref:Dehydratase n=1 Tax=Zavarzinia compransoris TaxID=1264899 RepID=A0A317EA58_9PROT|nr:MaoC family dehydratase [Zavarzinia compransoris]PWR23809.1 dehydratase [Zavarzinia compransoris]TDP48042.1 acyl dehydratase [Zavarzinia compransoris]